MKVLTGLALVCAAAVAMITPTVSTTTLPGSGFYGAGEARAYDDATNDSAPTPAMEFNMNQQSGGTSNATTTSSSSSPPASAAPLVTVAPPSSRTPTMAPPSPAPNSPAPRGDGSCQWEGYTLRHHSAKYFVGRVHRRGSIFGECINGQLKCYEDSGIADAQSTQFREMVCDPTTVFVRQRDLDLEDEAEEARSSRTSTAP